MWYSIILNKDAYQIAAILNYLWLNISYAVYSGSSSSSGSVYKYIANNPRQLPDSSWPRNAFDRNSWMMHMHE